MVRSAFSVGVRALRRAGPGRGQTFHRAHFLQIFRARLRPSAVSFGKRLVACTDDGALRFADGSAAACDVLVGCDGIRSAVRRCVLAGESEAVWSGTLVYRALFPVAMLRSVHGGPHPLEQGPTAVRRCPQVTVRHLTARYWAVLWGEQGWAVAREGD